MFVQKRINGENTHQAELQNNTQLPHLPLNVNKPKCISYVQKWLVFLYPGISGTEDTTFTCSPYPGCLLTRPDNMSLLPRRPQPPHVSPSTNFLL